MGVYIAFNQIGPTTYLNKLCGYITLGSTMYVYPISTTRVSFKWMMRRIIVRSHKASNSSDWVLKWLHHFQTRQMSRQHCSTIGIPEYLKHWSRVVGNFWYISKKTSPTTVRSRTISSTRQIHYKHPHIDEIWNISRAWSIRHLRYYFAFVILCLIGPCNTSTKTWL